MKTRLPEFSSTLSLPNDLPVAWIGASSFEPRCVGSLTTLRAAGGRVARALRFDYDSRTSEQTEAQLLRATNRLHQEEELRATGCDDVTAFSLRNVPTSSLIAAFRQFLQDPAQDVSAFVLDISCFTRLHVLSLAASLSALRTRTPLVLAYTQPLNYASMAERREDWEGFHRVVIAPVLDGALLRAESRARGVILLSHESQRLLVALSEFEPSEGVLIRPVTNERPDFGAITDKRNRLIVRRLSQIGGWTKEEVRFGNAKRVLQIVEEQARLAEQSASPLMIYPFGPKPLVFASGLAAGQAYPEASWIVYPVPSFYDPFATEGIGETRWAALINGRPISRDLRTLAPAT